ncbi:MAG TPA: O-antigen ligase family protein [Polyangiaceae bacterium]|nr:O-antigen ligase family protein [Polyangiaceae bacterium]
MIPLLYVFFALAVFGLILDVRLKNLRIRGTPLLPWVALLFAWSSLSLIVHRPPHASRPFVELCICVALYLLVAHGVQTFRGLRVVAGSVLAMVVFVCFVGAHQGLSPTGCLVLDPSTYGETSTGTPDGRPCDTVHACYTGDVEPGADYACEHLGLLGTTSVGGGRVRYRGVLQDPNELSLAGGIGLPLAFAIGDGRRRAAGKRALSAVTFALVLLCAVMTGSRGGQLVFLAVLGAYGLKRLGLKGLAVGVLLAAPLLYFGGRTGDEASSSTLQRLDCWASALSIWGSHPIFGVGLGQFTEYNDMTAHNSYLLALAELGLPGMLIFSMVFYVAAKTPLAVLREVEGGAAQGPQAGAQREFARHAQPVGGPLAGGQAARPWAMALLAAFAGLTVGIFFLSFTYHYVLWIFFGLSGALYSSVRTHYPSFAVRLTLKDFVFVFLIDVTIIAFVYAYTRAVLG